MPSRVPGRAGGARLDRWPYDGLPDAHPVDACSCDDGRALSSLLVDADGRVAVPTVPQD